MTKTNRAGEVLTAAQERASRRRFTKTVNEMRRRLATMTTTDRDVVVASLSRLIATPNGDADQVAALRTLLDEIEGGTR